MLTNSEAESEWACCNVSVLPISVTWTKLDYKYWLWEWSFIFIEPQF